MSSEQSSIPNPKSLPPNPRSGWGPLQPVGEALRFLTVLPVPGLPPMDETGIVRSMVAFPLVGLLIGAGGTMAGWLAGLLWGEPLRAIAIVITWMLLTLGLHLDGIADSCDALFSWRPRERKLEIMKDSRIGTMGALGLIAIVLLKIGALVTLAEQWWLGALLAPMWGRWADIYGIFWFPAAREGGMGRTFHDQVRRSDFAVATASALVIGLLLVLPWGMLVALVVWPIVHVLARRMVAALGGLTGDTYGALAEVGEVATLLVLAALAQHGMM
jgi:adenosylcobinamide-GDP ribazoletransferase